MTIAAIGHRPALTPEDLALFADDRAAYPARTGRPVETRSSEAFRRLLKAHRERRRWSQERLAMEAEMDHSLVSRLESGQRGPTRDAIGKIAAGLELTPHTRDDLLMAAGFLGDSYSPEQLRGAVALLRETTQDERDGALALIRAARRL